MWFNDLIPVGVLSGKFSGTLAFVAATEKFLRSANIGTPSRLAMVEYWLTR